MSLEKLSDDELLHYHRLYKDGVKLSQRFEIHKFHNYDTKFAYHIIRLLDEVEQLMTTGEMDLQRAKEPMKAIRRGEWKIQDVRDWAMEKEKTLSLVKDTCTLPEKPDEEALRQLLLSCLEQHYGSLSSVYQQPDWSLSTLKEIDDLINKVRTKMYN